MSVQQAVGVAALVATAGGVALFWERIRDCFGCGRPRSAGGGGATTPHGNPLPPVLHLVLGPRATVERRVIIIGDIHGCPAELRLLLDLLEYRRGRDLLLSVGDLVNKGPDSEKVLRIALEEGMQPVRGNHDASAYAAFNAWLAGKDIPKPKKQAWVAGLPPMLADFLAGLPLSIQLPAYGVAVVHAGAVPGVPLEQQRPQDLTAMRDVVPASEQQLADAAAEALDRAGSPDSQLTSSFDWGAANTALTRLAASGGSAGNSSSKSGSGGGDGILLQPGASGDDSSTAAALGLPPELRLVGRERRSPLGRAWAAVWRGPQHIVFGHDASRRLQVEPAATGVDTACVYGGHLTALVLPPLSAAGVPLMTRSSMPPGSQEIRLASGLPAYLVQVPAIEVHCHKQEKQAQGRTRQALEVQQAPGAAAADKKRA